MFRYFLILIPLLTACKPSAEQLEKDKNYEEKIISFTITDDSSPLGFWETKIEYPEFKPTNTVFKKINSEIPRISNEFQCEEKKGEKQFKAEVMSANESTASIQYIDSWLCAGMPHPDGRTGALTYNLKTGELIELKNEITSNAQEKLNAKIDSGLENALKAKQTDVDCPHPNWNYYYLTKTDFIFISTNNEYEYSECTVEFTMPIKEAKKHLKKDSILSSL